MMKEYSNLWFHVIGGVMVLIAEAKFVALTKIHIQPEKFSLASNAALDTVQKYHAAIKFITAQSMSHSFV